MHQETFLSNNTYEVTTRGGVVHPDGVLVKISTDTIVAGRRRTEARFEIILFSTVLLE